MESLSNTISDKNLSNESKDKFERLCLKVKSVDSVFQEKLRAFWFCEIQKIGDVFLR